jgi:hypothetical protein
MSHAQRVVILMIVCLCAAASVRAQAPVPEGWVVLPVEEYRALRARANPESPGPTPPPVDATLTRIDYDLRVDPSTSPGPGADTISGRALITVDVLREGWVKVPVPAGLMVREARVDGQPAALVEGPPAHVLLSRPGRAVLTLEISLRLSTAAGTESITLPSSAAPVSRATLTLPKGGVDLTVTGGFVNERSESATESRWTALGRPNQPLSFSWKRRADDRRAEMALRLRARVASTIGLGEEVSSISSAVRIEVLQGLAREVSVAIPAGLTVNQVNGATVADWESRNGLLRVRLLDPVATELSFVIQGESRLPADGDVTIPLVRVPAAERETGGLAISVLGAGEIETHQMRGLEPADVADLIDIPPGHESPSTAAFRMRPAAGTDPRSLGLTVKRYTPQAVLVANVEEARYRAIAAEDGLLLVEAHYAIRNNQRSFLKVTLPPGATIWSASVAGTPTRPGVAEGQSVLLALEKGRAGEDAPAFPVRLTFVQPIDRWMDRTTTRLQLPVLDLPISRTGVELYYSPRFRVALQPGPFRIGADSGVFTNALRSVVQRMAPAATPAPPMPAEDVTGTTSQFRVLIDRYRNEGGGRTVSGTLPIEVAFPAVGPSLFMASELTAESAAPAIDLAVRRIR